MPRPKTYKPVASGDRAPRCGFLTAEEVKELTLNGVSRPDIAMRAGVSLDRVTKFRHQIGLGLKARKAMLK